MFCYLVRHGKDDDTVRGGWSSHGLVSEGIQQVNKLAKELERKNLKIDCIYSSDLKRAEETSTIIANVLDVPIVYESGFREVNNGVLAGMKNELANKQYPGLFWSSLDYTECYPSGESPELFYERVKSAWMKLKKELIRKQKNGMLVTHGGVIEVILCIENDKTFSNKEKHYAVKAAEMVEVEIVE